MLDATVLQEPKGGINKDADSLFLAPHYYLHQIAAKLSVEASLEYFEHIRLNVKNEHKFGLLFGFNVTNSVAILIDTSADMQNVIGMVKSHIEKINESDEKNYSKLYLTLCNQGSVGPVYKFMDTTKFIQQLENISFSYNDTSQNESSVNIFESIYATMHEMPPTTNIYVFGDNNRHIDSPDMLSSILDIATEKRISINFIMRDNDTINRTGANKKDANQENYYEFLSSGTAGLYFKTKEEDIEALVKIISKEKWDVIMQEEDLSGSTQYSWNVQVFLAYPSLANKETRVVKKYLRLG